VIQQAQYLGSARVTLLGTMRRPMTLPVLACISAGPDSLRTFENPL
jgi:hypothetical protein